jgi:hypothetical protein
MIGARVVAKAGDLGTRSEAIVVSFDYKWYDRLIGRSFSTVIRKRIPTTFQPSWLYCYIKSPNTQKRRKFRSAICARASLVGIDNMDLNSALEISEDLDMSKREIEAYIGNLTSIGVYRLKKIQIAKRKTTLEDLAERLIFNPPQSFFILSNDAKIIIDEMCGFDTKPSIAERESHI